MLERIKEFIAYKGLSVRKFEQALGMSNGTIHNAVVKKSALSSQWIMKMSETFPELSQSWLITGKGPMLAGAAKPAKNRIPYYNVDFSGGFMEMYNDQTQNADDYIVDRMLKDAQLWCNLKGHSMEPTICDGDRIALKEVDPTTPIKWGNIYAIVTTDGLRTVKRIEKSEEEGKVKLVADNTDFASQEVSATSIAHLFRVVAHIGLL